jgi:small subunit ribosomal protein S21
MYIVKVGSNEGDLDRALKRLKSKILSDGLMEDIYRRRAFENPREKKKRKERLKYKKMALRNKRVD